MNIEMDENSKKQFLECANNYKKAISSNDYEAAFSIVYKGLKSAENENNTELAASLVSLIRAIYVLLDEKYGSNSGDNKGNDEDV